MDYASGEHQHQDGQNFYRPDDALAPNVPLQDTQQPAAASTPPAVAHQLVPLGHALEAQDSHDAAGAITWTASEFIDHQKTSSWYVLLGMAAVIVSLLVWLFTRDFFPTTAVFVGVLLLGVYATQKPRQQTYVLDERGVTIGNRHYPYSDFRSFSVVPEGAFLSVELMPMKRFATYASMYFEPADEDRILERLCQFIPMEEHSASLADSVMRRIHF